MIRTFTLSLTLALGTTLSAQLNGDGYYRLKNYGSERYAYITDDKGSIDLGTTTADLYAIQLWKNFDKAASDPASVVYIKSVGDKQYDIHGQGAELYKFLGHYLKVASAGSNLYYAYATQSSLTKYLYDGDNTEILLLNNQGWLSTSGTGVDNKFRKWYIIPVTSADDQYFGIKPDLTVSSKYYTTMYASFPYSFASSGIEAWYVSSVDNRLGVAIIEPVASGATIAGGTPLIFRVGSTSPASNKLNVGGNPTVDLASANMLRGVYFNNSMNTHLNQTAYDATTMRVLGTTSDGSLGFVTSKSLTTLPANKAYLPVSAGAPSELKLVTQEEYEQIIASGITSVKGDNANGPFDVYNILGVKVRSQVTSLQGLPKGIYLVGGKKVCVR